MRKTNLIDLSSGDPVNLERSMKGDGRNSGHFVQGHVDDTGVLESFTREGDSLWVRVRVDRSPSLMRLIVPKGYIAVDGTSLTVCEVDAAAATFTFMLIAYTQQHIIVPRKKVGDRVNLEVDVLGKYVERAAGGLLAGLERLEGRLTAALETVGQRLDRLEAKVEARAGGV
jgi:riboflavin synthase